MYALPCFRSEVELRQKLLARDQRITELKEQLAAAGGTGPGAGPGARAKAQAEEPKRRLVRLVAHSDTLTHPAAPVLISTCIQLSTAHPHCTIHTVFYGVFVCPGP